MNFGYDHKSKGERYFLNTLNGFIGAKAAAGGLIASGGIDDSLITGGLVAGGALVGSHALGKIDKYLFKKIGLNKKEDFKS